MKLQLESCMAPTILCKVACPRVFDMHELAAIKSGRLTRKLKLIYTMAKLKFDRNKMNDGALCEVCFGNNYNYYNSLLINTI